LLLPGGGQVQGDLEDDNDAVVAVVVIGGERNPNRVGCNVGDVDESCSALSFIAADWTTSLGDTKDSAETAKGDKERCSRFTAGS
jgi:hypothetical protein